MNDIGLSLQRCISLWQIIQILSKHSGFLNQNLIGRLKKKHTKSLLTASQLLSDTQVGSVPFRSFMRSQPLFFVAHRVKAGESLSKRVMGGSNKVSDPAVKSLFKSLILVELIIIWVFPKIWETPQIIHFRVFNYFHHPFWGFSPYFWKRPFGVVKLLNGLQLNT